MRHKEGKVLRAEPFNAIDNFGGGGKKVARRCSHNSDDLVHREREYRADVR
jgi:hypothetical protein